MKTPEAWKSETQAGVPLEPALLLQIWHEQNVRSWWRARKAEKEKKAERREEGEQELIQWSPFADGVNLTASDSAQQ
jgi:hypothetical protein